MAEVRVAGTPIDYQDFKIEIPTSPVDIAPSATINTSVDVSVSPMDTVEIDLNSGIRFTGNARSHGTIRQDGTMQIDVSHNARDMFDELVTIDVTGPPTDEEVLNAALNDTSFNFTLTYNGTPTTLNDSYSVDNRDCKDVFGDMADRVDRIWHVNPVADEIFFEQRGAGATWQALDEQTDQVVVQKWDRGSVDTVINIVLVLGQGTVGAVTQDGTSITNYGIRTGNTPYRYRWLTDEDEADAIADAILQPDPVPEGKLLVGRNVGAIAKTLVNQTIDLTSTAKNINETGLVIEKQTVREGRTEFQIGGGVGETIREFNRSQRSTQDGLYQ